MNREFEVAEPHAEWLELCALATTGALEPAERERFRLHLARCARCRAVLSEYRAIAREGMPLVADNFALLEDELIEIPGWDSAEAKRRFFAKLDQPLEVPQHAAVQTAPARRSSTGAIALWAGLAACITLAVGIGSFQLGRRSVPVPQFSPSPLVAKVQSLSTEKASLDKRLDQENANLAALQKETTEHRGEISNLQEQLQVSEARVDEVSTAKKSTDQQLQTAAADRDSLAARLASAQQAYQSVETELTNLRTQRQQDLLHYASLDVEVTDLRRKLHDAESRVNDDSQYLASDRDIRELMGARQLYIADVIDVDQNGDRRKPFGRVFYTKGKSLIFYAFDLDRQPGVREASTYQAWAREGSDRARPVSLGIFYVDSETNRRWALKASDPKVLAEINSVFVTVEPKGGSQNPTGKPLLYAYLRTETPNHP
jgi:anti-sigma factor RsiW